MKSITFTGFSAILLLTAAGCKNSSSDGNTIAAPAATPVATASAPAGQNWVDTVVRTPDGGYRMGNPDAAVTLIEYGSRTCPHCAAFDAEGLPAMKAGPIAAGRLSYEFRDYPVHQAIDVGPILLGQCVAPAQFFPMLDAMMRNQQTLIYRTTQIPDADQRRLATLPPAQVTAYLANFYGYTDFVKQRGVTTQRVQQCLGDQAAMQAIATNMQAANERYNIAGTPTFILNGQVLQDTTTWAQVQAALHTAGAM